MPGLLSSNMRSMLISTSLVQKAVGFTSHGRSPSGVRLPPLPFRMGGVHFREDSDFVRAGVGDVKRLSKWLVWSNLQGCWIGAAGQAGWPSESKNTSATLISTTE